MRFNMYVCVTVLIWMWQWYPESRCGLCCPKQWPIRSHPRRPLLSSAPSSECTDLLFEELWGTVVHDGVELGTVFSHTVELQSSYFNRLNKNLSNCLSVLVLVTEAFEWERYGVCKMIWPPATTVILLLNLQTRRTVTHTPARHRLVWLSYFFTIHPSQKW